MTGRTAALCVPEWGVVLDAGGGETFSGICWVAFPGDVDPAVIASMPPAVNNLRAPVSTL